MILKNNTLKVERVLKTFKNLNSFETMLKMLKMMQIYLKNVFFWIFVVFAIFGFFENFIKKVSQKLGNNKCPLFTMLTKQNFSMFCIVSFVKKTCLLIFLTCSISTHLKTILFFSFYVSFSFPSLFFFFFLSFSLFFSSYFFLLTRDPIWRSP